MFPSPTKPTRLIGPSRPHGVGADGVERHRLLVEFDAEAGGSGRRSTPSRSAINGAASMKSRRSSVHPGGSQGYSMNGPPPTPAHTCRLAISPMPLVQVCGVNQRLRLSASSANVRVLDIPSASIASGW